jgi:riboflavin kinase/FMN adenylyltransferase
MQVVTRASELHHDTQAVSVAIGMFDGVHLGHQSLLRMSLQDARQHHGLAVAITFDRHPNYVLAPERAPPALQTLDHRLALFEAQGLEAAVVISFDTAFSRVSAVDFARNLVSDLAPVTSICVGQGFTFGHQRLGDIALLESLQSELGYSTRILTPVRRDGRVIRSTWIRELVAAGQLQEAAALLGRPYSVAGRVVQGDHLGHQLGFPTANLDVTELLLPPHGVYAARACVAGETHSAVLNVGLRPTLTQPVPALRFEVHLLDFDDDLYGKTLEVTPHHHLRLEQRFDSLDALRHQIHQDILQARSALTP